ncbi:metalloregulator ArsR/SmtB family transcription factor [Luteimonas sp. MC1828]|uniref:ArsR/SmtB family transcription factor n=1 Tax=Luteimonas sp. MC1828 TaxID=2799787 RepID=UPI0018F1D2D9|nr:metalloregulator ArsR/SmtB family transcription factor [Luteimonas sp. MC1828]MBJ7574148.1 winged helix-turn-helix transcriptional regulator [Luteimonas sp. MC1828]
MELKNATTALAALGQPTRLSIFRLLVEAGPDGRMPGEIAEALALPGATLSFHLKELSAAGLIQGEPRGRHICYRADFEAMNGLVEFLTRNCCGGDPTRCQPPGAAAVTARKGRARA